MIFNPHKLGLHKILQHIPLSRILDARHQAKLRKAVNIADLRRIAKGRAHKERTSILKLFVMSAGMRATFHACGI